MRYKSGIYMKRSTKIFGLALLFLFSARFVMGMPAAQPDLLPFPQRVQQAQPMTVTPNIPVIPTVPAMPVAPVPMIPVAPAQTIQDASMPPVAPAALPTQTAPTVMASETPEQLGIPEQIVEPNNFLPTQESSNTNILPTNVIPEVIGQPTANNNKPKDLNSSEKDIYLNFDNADLLNFVNYIAEIRQMNLVVDKTIESVKISLTIREPLTAEGAWNVFLTVLEMGGFSIIKIPGDLDSDPLIFKVIPKDQKQTQPLPAYINVSPDTLPDNDINIRYVLFLTNMNVADLEELLKSMLSDKGFELPVKDVNGFVITDKSLNVKAAAKVLLELDQMGTAEAVTVIKLKSANAVDVKTLLEGLIKQPEVSPLARLLGKTAEGSTSYFPPGTKVIAEERTNSLILLGSPKVIKKIEDFIVNHLDTELKQAKSPLHVYELQYTDATQIATILQEATAVPESVAGQNASKYGAIRGGVKYFKSMTFKVDKDGNRLVVSSTDKVDWKLLKKIIKDLDKPQPQIAVESMIVTVDVTDTKELGGAVRNKKHGMLGINVDAQSAGVSTSPTLEYDSSTNPLSLLGNMISQIAPQQGLTTLTFGKVGNIWGILQALKTQTNTSVLSQPFMTIANKTSANVVVGSEQRIIQEEQGGTGGLKGYESVTANTDLTIVPQINLDGLVRLDIDLKIDEFANAEATQKIKRNLKTNVAVADGQVLVLGGFVKTKIAETKYKTPLLGDIPILGWFFKDQKRIITKEYLFIFLCPTIVKPRQTPGMNLYTKMKLHEATDSIEDGITTKRTPDPVHNWFFNPDKENYSHKVIDFANARYQPTTVDIQNDPFYRAQTVRAEVEGEKHGNGEDEDGDIQAIKKQKNIETSKVVESSGIKTVIPEETKSALASNVQQQSVLQSSLPQTTLLPSVSTLENPEVQSVDQMPGDGLAFMEPPIKIENASALPLQQPMQESIAQGQQIPQASLMQPLEMQTQTQSVLPKPVIEQAKREEFKNLLTQEPLPVKPTVPNQVPQANPQTEFKRDEFKRFISPEIKVNARRSQDLNFDIQKRNRLKEFLSKNPSLTKSRGPVVADKKEALT